MTDLDRIRAVLDQCAHDSHPDHADPADTYHAYQTAIDAISRIAYPEARDE